MIDLHTHSTCSDGTVSPENLVFMAARKGIHTLALTDHDTIDGLEEGENAAKSAKIKFVRGVELSINCEKGELHLLGLDLSRNTEEMDEVLAVLREHRKNRNIEIIRMMNDAGFPTTMEQIEEIAGGGVIGRSHLAKHLLNTGAVKTINEAFSIHLRKGGALYVPKKKLDLETAVNLILKAGGIPVVAHPLSTYYSMNELDKKVGEWKETGVMGLETLHPSANRSKAEKLEKLAKKHGLSCSAGSDFHGENKPKVKLGRVGKGRKIPDSYLKVLDRG